MSCTEKKSGIYVHVPKVLCLIHKTEQCDLQMWVSIPGHPWVWQLRQRYHSPQGKVQAVNEAAQLESIRPSLTEC